MSATEQIYCTHCTYGTSAIHRETGATRDDVHGYGVRAGSLQGDSLKQGYERIEHLLHYALPEGTPPGNLQTGTAANSPKRLVYLPGVDDVRVLARICYRQTDTTGRRYGSYFAHVLTRELHDGGNPRPHWNGMDALQLWDAPHWVEEDVPPSGDSYRLPRITDLASWRGKEKPAIDDEVLQGFFTAPAGGPFHDPGNVIPSRWRALKPEQRTEAFASALRGFLASDPAPGKPLVLVIEPSMAALWFYGMLRLLPEGPLREAISFSTYEPDPTRCSTSLAATCFHEPAAGDLREEAYRGPGFVLNTFNNRQSADVGTNSQYAELILRALGACCRQGASQDSATATWWRGVDRVLRRLGPAGSTSREALENLAALENQAARMFDAAGVAPEKSSWKHRAFRDAVVRQLKSRGPLGATLRRVVGTPVHVPLVELLGSRTDHETAVNAVGYLVASLPDGQIAAMLARDVPDNCKVQILVQYVRKSSEGQNVPSLPPGCEDFWSSQLAPRVLAQLAADEEALLKRFCNAARRKLSEPISVGMQLIRAARSMRADDSARNRLEEEVRDEDLLQLHGEHGANLFEQPSLAQSALGELLKRMLDSLPSFPGEFDRRFALLKDAKDHLPSEQDQDTLQHWKECQDAIRNVDYWVPKVSVSHLRRQFDLRAIKKLALQGRPLPHLPTELVNLQNACAELADAAVKVIPPSAYHADESVRRLRELAEQVLGHEMMPEEPWPFDALWQKVHLCLAGNGFPRQQHLGTMRTDSSATATGSAPKGKSIAAVAVVVTLLVAAVVVLVLSMSEAPSRGKGKATAGKNQGDRETGTNPADTTPGPKEPRTPPGNPSPIPPEGVVVDPPHEEPVRPTIHDAPPLPGGRSLSVLGNRSNFGGSPQLWLDGQGDLSRLSLRVGTSGELLPEWYTENYFAAWQVLRADKQPSEVFLPETNRFYDESHQVELAGGQPEMLIRVEFWLKGSQGQPPRRMFVTPRWPLPALRPRQTMTAEFTLNRGRDGEIVPLWNGLPTDRKRGHTAPAGGDPVSDDTEPPEPTEPAEPAQPERVHADWGTTADLTSVGGETSFRTGNPRLLADRTVGTITVQIEDPPAWFSDRAVARWQAVCLIDGQSRRFPDANKCFDLDTEAELDRQPQQTAVQLAFWTKMPDGSDGDKIGATVFGFIPEFRLGFGHDVILHLNPEDWAPLRRKISGASSPPDTPAEPSETAPPPFGGLPGETRPVGVPEVQPNGGGETAVLTGMWAPARDDRRFSTSGPRRRLVVKVHAPPSGGIYNPGATGLEIRCLIDELADDGAGSRSTLTVMADGEHRGKGLDFHETQHGGKFNVQLEVSRVAQTGLTGTERTLLWRSESIVVEPVSAGEERMLRFRLDDAAMNGMRARFPR